MSFSVTIAGHTPSEHNQAVKDATFAFVKAIKAIDGAQPSVTGYTYDGSGDNVQLNDALMADYFLREQAQAASTDEAIAQVAAAQTETPGPEPVPAGGGDETPSGGETPPVTTPEPVTAPAPADSTENAPTAPTEGA